MTTKIVIATDSFKDCLTAAQACEAIAQGILTVSTEVDIVCLPLADGGEGTAQAMMATHNGQWIECCVTGPLLSEKVNTGFAWFAQSKTALVEMASASGLELLSKEQRNPLKTSTYGTGQLILAAAEQGAERILLAVGGSATVDCGCGCAAALGWRFLDYQGRPLEPTGGNLLNIRDIQASPWEWNIPVEVLCDVDNPLLGPQGAARVFGPQKGATSTDVILLEVGLTHIANLITDRLYVNIGMIPRSGAAGGLAAGARAFLGATLVNGADAIAEQCGLTSAIMDADWIITGEGCFDMSSLNGKTVSGVLKASRGYSAKICVLAGRVTFKPGAVQSVGIHDAMACTPKGMDLTEALLQGESLLTKTAREWAKKHLKKEKLETC